MIIALNDRNRVHDWGLFFPQHPSTQKNTFFFGAEREKRSRAE
jgi:hypothetical protein